MIEAAVETVDRKSGYHGDRYELETILTEAIDTFQRFAHPPVDDDTLRGSLWRAYGRVKGSIRVAFTQADLRTSAGCAHHCAQAVQQGALDWEDAWRPAVERAPRAAWEEKTIDPVVEVEDGYGPAAGPLEAWARFEP